MEENQDALSKFFKKLRKKTDEKNDRLRLINEVYINMEFAVTWIGFGQNQKKYIKEDYYKNINNLTNIELSYLIRNTDKIKEFSKSAAELIIAIHEYFTYIKYVDEQEKILKNKTFLANACVEFRKNNISDINPFIIVGNDKMLELSFNNGDDINISC